MSGFPIFVELAGRTVLVVGGGAVARHKVEVLRPFGPRLLVIAPEIQPELLEIPGVQFRSHAFCPEDLDCDPVFAVAATDDLAVNRRVAAACRARNIPVNIVDADNGGDFPFPALVKRGNLTVGVSTGGASPRAAGYFRQRIEEILPEKTPELLEYLRKSREEIKGEVPEPEVRTKFIRAVADAALQKGEPLTAEEEQTVRAALENGRPPVGQVYLVGAGCGGADLITVRGLRLLQSCDAVVYDELIDRQLLDEAPAGAVQIPMGKRAGRLSASQEEIIEELIRQARLGRKVVRLKGGDPYLFGRGGEELLALTAAGIPCQEVPGIPSAIGIPAQYGIPVTHRGVSRSVHIVTASTARSPDGLPEDLPKYAALEGTLVFLMGLGKREAICRELIRLGKDPATPAAVLSGGNAPHPVCIRATLATLPERARDVQPPAILVVGEVAALCVSQ